MNKHIDLHVHSVASDGTCTPSEDVELAVKAHLKAFALTDHDNTNGYDEAYEKLKEMKAEDPTITLELIPGIEISAAYMHRDIHILGLYINPKDEKLLAQMQHSIDSREDRNYKMIEKFKAFNIDISMEELKEGNPDTVVTRAHFSRVLIRKGYVKDSREAFEKYLNIGAPCFVDREYLEPEDAIKLILGAGGVPILAHPFLYKLDHNQVLELLEQRLIPAGLKGLEVMHSTNKDEDTEVLKAMAVHYGLLMSGGSDFHGENKPDISIGTGRGNLKVPSVFLENIRKASAYYMGKLMEV